MDCTDMGGPLLVPICAPQISHVRQVFLVVMAVKCNTVILWFKTLRSLVGAHRRFGGETSGDGSITFLQNDGNLNTQGLNNGCTLCAIFKNQLSIKAQCHIPLNIANAR